MIGTAPEATQRFVCPCCRSALVTEPDRYECPACGRNYPILWGIPDFRIRPDRYLSIADERAKAAHLHAFASGASFDALVDHYYAITDDVPASLARNFARYVRNAPARGRALLASLAPDREKARLLDIGCGSGGLLLAAANDGCAHCVGVDIGLRWLVIAQKRLREAGIEGTLVCADIAAMPFANASFDIVVADDTVEHAYDPAQAVRAASRQVRRGGDLVVTAINRYWLGPHPAVGLWGAGLLPKAVRSRLLRALRGTDSLRNTGFVSPGMVMRIGRQEGMTLVSAQPRSFDLAAARERSPLFGHVAALYEWCRAAAAARSVLLWIGPTFEIVLRRTVKGKASQ